MGRDDANAEETEGGEDISIHAPRMGRDAGRTDKIRPARDFNPRAPHGARLDGFAKNTPFLIFQSTRPAWGATSSPLTPAIYIFYFNPRAPHGARLDVISPAITLSIFQSTRPAWGATESRSQKIHLLFYFNPRAPHGARLI